MMNLVLAAVLLAPAQAGAQAAQQKDRVTTKRGSVVEGTVQKDTWKEVVVQVGAASQTVPTADVSKVEYYDAPPAFKGAMAAIDSEKWSEANSALTSAEEYANSKEKGVIKPRAWFAPYLAYFRGFCQMQLGQYDNAIKQFERIRKDFKESRFLPESYDRALQCFRERQDEKGMLAVETEIGQAPAEIKNELQVRAKKQRAELLYDKNNYGEARAIFDQIKGSGDPEISRDATAGIIRCLKGLKDTAGLQTFCNNVLSAAQDPGLLLIASNALGDIHFEKKEWVKAREFYVQSVVKYNPGRTGTGIERDHEQAIFRLARCYQELMDAAKDAKAKEFFQTAASSAYREVAIEYPSGRYREEAETLARKLEPKDEKDEKKDAPKPEEKKDVKPPEKKK
jgi:tetratricopeptide (TPR) repeat protein